MRAAFAAASAARHSIGALAEAVLIAAIVAAILLALSPVYRPADFLAGTDRAAAAKPSANLELVVLSSQVAALSGSGPWYGGEVTFNVSTNQTDRPWVNLRCYQDGNFVYDGWHGFFDEYMFEPVFTLSSDHWTGGSASCEARLISWPSNGKMKVLATTRFDVAD